MGSSEDGALIIKNILSPGTKPTTFKDGAKVYFHYQTRLSDNEKTVIDDSKKIGQPMELVLGKKFKLDVWETIVQKMAINEVAQFKVHKSLVLQYPYISKKLRDVHIPPEERKSHCCAMTVQSEGIGYEDLNNLLRNPVDLEFIIELLKVEQPEDYDKEAWQMNEEERLQLIPDLKEKGNKEFYAKHYNLAADNYAKAIGLLEQLILKEKPHCDEWTHLNNQKLPLLLNYSQCKLYEGDYYAVIEHCTTVLKTEPNNIKALFRRAKAHVGAWNPEEAKCDFNAVIKIDGSLEDAVKKELHLLDELIKEKDKDDKEKLKKLFCK